MAENEPDYLSDDFLKTCVSQDVRPGLLHLRQNRRLHEQHKRQQITNELNRQRFKPRSVLEAERREEGMSRALSSDNKGFALLQKMGYRPGSGLGRNKDGEGRSEPIPVEVKSDRSGLGHGTAVKEARTRRLQKRMRLLKETSDPEEFRRRKRMEVVHKQLMADLGKSQRACETLDAKQGKTEAKEAWFWPERTSKKEDVRSDDDEDDGKEPRLVQTEEEDEDEEEEDDDDDETDMEPSEQLEILTKYLRDTYFFCIWCGTEFDDEKDLQDACPGPTRDDH